MRSIKLTILFFLFAVPAFGQFPYIPFVQGNSGTRGSSPETCAPPVNVTTGNIVIISATWQTGTGTPVITDTLSQTWTQNLLDTSDSTKLMVATATMGTSGALTVTVTETSATALVVNCAEFLPNFSTTVDTSSTNTFSGTPSSVTSNTITTTKNTDFIYSVIGGNVAGTNLLDGATSVVNGWVQIGAAASSSAGYLFAGANTTYNVKWTNASNSTGTCAIIAFQSNSIAITSPTALPDAGLNVAYNYTLTATGGAGSYTWSITSGALQTGLSLNTSTGAITGTPTAGPQNSITFQVTDGTHTTTKAVTLKVATTLNAISFVQGKTQNSGTSGLAFTSNVTSGNLIVANSGWSSGITTRACTDTLGTPFQLIFFENNQATNNISVNRIQIYAGIAPSTGADTVTCGLSNTGIAEFSNVGLSDILNDNTGFTIGNTATPATVTSNSLSTLVVNELILGSCQAFTALATMTVDSPFTSVGAVNQVMNLGYRIVTTATGYTMSCDEASNTSGQWAFGLVALRPSGGAAAPAGGRGPKGKIL